MPKKAQPFWQSYKKMVTMIGRGLCPPLRGILPAPLYRMGKPLYIENMDVDIKFCQSTFKHGISEADIRCAIDTVTYDGCLDRDTVRVFHAMKCRKIYRHLLKSR
jgi:hypothetical protein